MAANFFDQFDDETPATPSPASSSAPTVPSFPNSGSASPNTGNFFDQFEDESALAPHVNETPPATPLERTRTTMESALERARAMDEVGGYTRDIDFPDGVPETHARATRSALEAHDNRVRRGEMMKAGTLDTTGTVLKKTVQNLPARYQTMYGAMVAELDTINDQFRSGRTLAGGGLYGGAMQLADYVVDPLVSKLSPELGRYRREGANPQERAQHLAEGKAIMDRAMDELAANAPKVQPGSPQFYAAGTVEGVAMMAPALAAGILTRSPALGASIMGSQAYADRVADSIARGRSPEQAHVDGLAASAFEFIPEAKVLKIMTSAGKSALTRILKSMGAEATQEALTEALTIAYDRGVLDDEVTLDEAMRRMVDAGIIGGAVGGSLATLSQPFVPPSPTGTPEPGIPPSDSTRQPGRREPTIGTTEVRVPPGPSFTEGEAPSARAGTIAANESRSTEPADSGSEPVQVAEVPNEGAVVEPFHVEPAANESRRDVGTIQAEDLADISHASPELVARLEAQGLATRSETNAPRLTKLGQKRLDALRSGGQPAPAQPAPKQPTTVEERWQADEQLRADLGGMKGETGWAEKGGYVIRDPETEQVTGRTTWVPNAEWWKDRPKGLKEEQVHAAVDKALAGEKLSKRERAMVEYMTEVADERRKLADFLPEPQEAPADYGELDIDDRHEAAMVTRLAELDEGSLERFAIQYDEDRIGFLRAVKGRLDAIDHETTDRGRAQGEGAAIDEGQEESAARFARRQVGPDLFGEDTSARQALADEARRRDQQRSPGTDVSADTGRAGDLFSRGANRQVDIEDVTKRREQGAAAIARVEEFGRALEAARAATNAAPSEGQKQAGNYAKGTLPFAGLTIALENPKGSTRTGKNRDGTSWSRKMNNDYGYVKRSESKDGDEVDVFLAGAPDTGRVFVVNQVRPDSGAFDEHKVVLGAHTKQEAERIYRSHYPKNWKGLGSLVEMPTEQFVAWVKSGNTKRPVGERTDASQRKRVKEMTPEQMRRALLTHELTGISNRRAYEEADRLPVQVAIDVDSLKWVNDNLGHDSGNELLKAVATALQDETSQAFHISGDEFVVQARTEADARATIERVVSRLKDARIEVEMPGGEVKTVTGLGLSYGLGETLEHADRELATHKAERERQGLRAPRGEKPPGATVRTVAKGEDQAGGAAEEVAAPKFSRREKPEYPLASRDEWYGEGDYEARGGRIDRMSPDEFLAKVRPLTIDAESRENIDLLKAHIRAGKSLDPLLIRADGKEDGRHRAHAARELGIRSVPVIVYGGARRELPKENRLTDLSTYTPTLYRETNLEQLHFWLRESQSVTSMMFDTVHLADSTDMALGQGANKGVLLELDAAGLQGRVNLGKPGLAETFRSGMGEYLAEGNEQSAYQRAVRAFTIKKDAKGPKWASMRFRRITAPALEKAGWTKTKDEGGLTYRRPEAAAPKFARREKPEPRLTRKASPEELQVRVDAFAKQMMEEHPLEDFDLRVNRNGTVRLELIHMSRASRNEGEGTAVMKKLAQFADENDVVLVLAVAGKEKRADWGTTSKARLERFYRRFGFVSNRGQRKRFEYSIYDTMYRDPRPAPKRVPYPGTKQELKDEFIRREGKEGDEFWGITYDEKEGWSEFRATGYSGVQCTGYACAIRDKLGRDRVKIRGFAGEDNPKAQVADDGHDFAIVDDRYIVDPWATDIAETSERGVFDLKDPADAAEIKRLYGDPKTWRDMDEDVVQPGEVSQVQTEAFRRWFHGSKVVTADGRPLRVYHGTGHAEGIDQFDVGRPPPAKPYAWFAVDPNYANIFSGRYASVLGHAGYNVPVYLSIKKPIDLRIDGDGEKVFTHAQFTDLLVERGLPEHLANQVGEAIQEREGSDYGASVWRHVRQDIDHVLKDALIEAGFDGIHQRETVPDDKDRPVVTEAWVAFRPEQIKSAVGNRGTFDPKNPDIRFARRTRVRGRFPANLDPMRLTEDEFVAAHRTGDIPSEAYSKYKDVAGVAWLGAPSERSQVVGSIQTKDGKTITFRKSGERLQYTARDAEGWTKYDKAGMAVMMTPEEIRAEGLEEFDETIVAYDGETPVGWVSNEWGAMGVWVTEPYQRQGIATELARHFLRNRPDMQMGQMTEAGESFARGLYRSLRARPMFSIGEARFRRGDQGRGMLRTEVQATVDRALAASGFEQFPRVVVVSDYRQLPSRARVAIIRDEAQETTGAVFVPGLVEDRIFLLASNNATEREVLENLYHEGVGHYGLSLAMDPERYNEVMDGLWRDARDLVKAAARRNSLDTSIEQQRRLAAEEVIAYAAGRVLTQRSMDARVRPWWNSLLQAVRSFFQRLLGIQPAPKRELPDIEADLEKRLVAIIEQAKRALERTDGGVHHRLDTEPKRAQRREIFYSAIERAVEDVQQGRASGAQWWATIKGKPGVTEEEAEWMELRGFLKDKKSLTKQELLGYIRKNRVTVRTQVLGDPEDKPDQKEGDESPGLLDLPGLEALAQGLGYRVEPDPYEMAGEVIITGPDGELVGDYDELPPALQEGITRHQAYVDQMVANETGEGRGASETRYERYVLPGAEAGSYREVLLMLGRRGARKPEAKTKTTRELMGEPRIEPFAEFIKTDEAVDIGISQQLDDQPEAYKNILIYPKASNVHILQQHDGRYHVVISNSDELFTDLAAAEDYLLNEFVIPEGIIEGEGPTASDEHYNTHWRRKNVLAHVRFNERRDRDGKRVLFLEELQSDWHQQGRKKGYRTEPKVLASVDTTGWTAVRGPHSPEFAVYNAAQEPMGSYATATAEEAIAVAARGESGWRNYDERVADAPFKTKWVELSLKRMIQWAAEHGYDRIAWTPGTVQAQRFNLGTVVNQVEWSPGAAGAGSGDRTVTIFPVRAAHAPDEGVISLTVRGGKVTSTNTRRGQELVGHPLAEVLGAELAERIRRNRTGFLRPEELTVIGGTGIRAFYDDIIPRTATKLIKKWGASVGTTAIKKDNAPWDALARISTASPDHESLKDSIVTVQSFDVTEQMREAALAGQPLFARRWAPGARKLGENIENGNDSFDLPEPSLRSRAWNYLVYKAQDKFIDLFRTQQAVKDWRQVVSLPEEADAYLQQTLYHGRLESRMEEYEKAYVDPLVKLIKASGFDWQQVEEYLYARHAQEANARIREINPDDPRFHSGMTDAEAQAVLARYMASPRFEKLGEIARHVDAMTKFSRDTMVLEGLESPELIKAWEETYDFYVPLKGWADSDVEDAMPKRGRGYDVGGKLTKMRTGRTTKAATILANIVAQGQSTLILAEKAKVGRALYQFVKDNPAPNLWKVDQVEYTRYVDPNSGLVREAINPAFKLADNVLRVRIEGVDHHITFNPENEQMRRMAAALKNLNADQMDPILGVLHGVNRWLSMVNTSLNPEFTITNALRDMQTALANLTEEEVAGIRTAVVRDWRAAWAGIRSGEGQPLASPPGEWAAHWEAFKRAGGKVGWIDHYKSPQDLEKKLRRHLRPDNVLTLSVRGITAAKEFIENENLAVENAIRLSTFVNLKRAGLSPQRAAEAAKNLTVNFNRKGDIGTAMNSLYLFFNASMQGTARLWRLAKHPKGRKVIAGFVAAGIAMDLLMRFIAGDDEDGENLYDKIPEHVKEKHIVISLPPHLRNKAGEAMYIKIPLPYGFNALFYSGTILGKYVDYGFMGNVRRVEPAADAGRVAGAFLGAFSPIGDAEGGLSQYLLPTLADPFVQLSDNKSWWGGPIMPEDMNEDAPRPDSERFFRSVPLAYREFATWLNSKTGGTEITPGYISVSPETFQHWADFATGGFGRFMVSALNAPVKAVLHPDELEVEEIPFFRRVVGGIGDRQTQELFFARLQQIQYAKREIDAIYKMGVTTPEGQERLTFVANRYPVAVKMLREAYPNFATQRSLEELDKDQILRRLRSTIEPARPVNAEPRGRLGQRHNVPTVLSDARKEIRRLEARPDMPAQERRQRIEEQKLLIKKTLLDFNRKWSEVEDATRGERHQGKLIEMLGPLLNGKPRREQVGALRKAGYSATAELFASLPSTPDRFAREYFRVEAAQEDTEA